VVFVNDVESEGVDRSSLELPGLSYTSFGYSDLHITPSSVRAAGQGGPVATVTATVTNTGKVAGADVAQLYVTDPASTGEPPRQLARARSVDACGTRAPPARPLTRSM
jgi:hypothetical protein